jgi:hypothetical protein
MFPLLREDERAVCDDVVLTLLPGDDFGFVPGFVQLGRETRGPFVIAASDGAEEDFDVRHVKPRLPMAYDAKRPAAVSQVAG